MSFSTACHFLNQYFDQSNVNTSVQPKMAVSVLDPKAAPCLQKYFQTNRSKYDHWIQAENDMRQQQTCTLIDR